MTGRMSMSGESETLLRALRSSPAVLTCLRAVRALALPQGCIAAGIVRSVYWAHCHGHTPEGSFRDVDVVFFDPESAPERDAALERALHAQDPALRWEVTNQAHVHTWYEAYVGVPLAPLASVAEGIGLWPETATCVGVRLGWDEALELVAPCGIDDLLTLTWRANPRCPDPHAFERRLAQKRVDLQWPKLRVVR